MRRVSSANELTSSKIAALTRYWEAKRGRRAMPLWSDIDPAEIKPLLPHLLVTRYEYHPFRARFVLVGTWLAQYAGGDFTGRYLDEMDFSSELDTDWPEHHRRFVTEAKPTFGICRFLTASGVEREYESAMFPIAGPDGATVERALGIEDFRVGEAVDDRIVAPPPRVIPPDAKPPADAAHLEAIGAGDAGFRRCLAEANLPVADLYGSHKHYYRLVERGEIRAYGGLEIHGEHGLLRSVVVEGPRRGRGFGRSLVRGVIEEARRLGLKDLYLLTETATRFFDALDFLPCPREQAPREIQSSEQFASLCPSTAKLLRRAL